MQTWMDPAIARHDEDELSVLLVEVHGVRCGLPVADVLELHAVVAVTGLPGAPAVVEGMIDVRGSVVAVVDLRARLGLPRRPPLLSDHLVVSRVGARTVALRVDRAVELTALDRSCIDRAEDLTDAPHLSGVARLDNGLVLIHDLASFLSGDEAAALDGALEELEGHPPQGQPGHGQPAQGQPAQGQPAQGQPA